MSASHHTSPLLTVVVPCFNEAATIGILLRRVMDAPYDKQVLVVDDGSTDGTADALRKWQGRDNVTVITHQQNRGKGAAIRSALPHATGRFVIIQDGDLETDPQDYPKLIAPLLEDRADFVIGSRFLRARPCGLHNRLSHLGVKALNWCVRLIYGVHLTDEACCYKAISTETLRQFDLRCERFEFCPEVVAKACRLRLRIEEVSISYYPRSRTAGKKIRYRDGMQALATIWRFRNWQPIELAAKLQWSYPRSTSAALAPCDTTDFRPKSLNLVTPTGIFRKAEEN